MAVTSRGRETKQDAKRSQTDIPTSSPPTLEEVLPLNDEAAKADPKFLEAGGKPEERAEPHRAESGWKGFINDFLDGLSG